ncbi:GNAT family N-acetyltransferase [Sphingomonas ursincola]|uniref:GNAT family N-acetyltransferase n=1 Tax=Sphingomonas ursincola TaxID=56361 RepID=A0A7V8RGM0_9SPHN|nr:GNAT family N-acetyltransferase [Sphingomonas ursincola]MBA1375915.1 GNAT family N-acetyltransferase [Sphingomonas ursincola]
MRTERLIIEPLVASHAEALMSLLDERVNRHFAPEDVPTSQAALRAQFAEMAAAATNRRDGARFLPFVVKTIADGHYIGRLEALVHAKDAEIAFVFIPQSWGQGFATEATSALMVDLQGAGVERFWACVTPSNEPSLALCSRLNFARSELPTAFALATYDVGDIVFSFEVVNERQI